MSVSHYTQLAQGVQSALSGLAIPGVQTLLQKFPSDRPALGIAFPCQQVTLPADAERPEKSMNKADDWEYPFLITLMQPANQDFSWDTTWLSWRRKVEQAFHGKRPLPAVDNNPLLYMDAGVISAPVLIHDANLNVGQLLLWARQRETRTSVAATSSLSGGNLVYASVGQAVQAVIQAIGLAGVSSSQVILLKDHLDRKSLTVNLANGPVIFVAHAGEKEEEVGPMVGKDDWEWPALVTILRASDQSLTWDDTWFLMREKIRNAFHHQLLLAVGTVLFCDVEPRTICDPGAWHDQNVDVGQLLVNVRSRELRS